MLILDPITNKLIEFIKQHNHKAYIIGGAVRDSVLNLKYNDIDISVDASLDEIKEMFKDYSIKEYKKGHTIGIVFLDKYVELSSLDENNINVDLKNRDFTINAIAVIDDKILDPYNGLGDIKNRVIRTIMDPAKTIKDDPIRILRAIRFDATLHFNVDPKLLDFINNNYKLLDNVSEERIRDELNKILLTRKPSRIIEKYFNVFTYLIPPLKDTYGFLQHNIYHHLDVFKHTMSVLENTDNILELKYIALFHDIKKPECFSMDEKGVGHFYRHYEKSAEYANEFLNKYKFSNEFIKKVYKIIYFHDYPLSLKDSSILKFLNKFGKLDLDLYFKIRVADIKGQNPNLINRIELMNKIEIKTKKLALEGIYTVNGLVIDGKDIEALGYNKNKINFILKKVLEAYMEGKIKNTIADITNYLNNNHFGDDDIE